MTFVAKQSSPAPETRGCTTEPSSSPDDRGTTTSTVHFPYTQGHTRDEGGWRRPPESAAPQKFTNSPNHHEDIFPSTGILPIPITPETADRVSPALTVGEDLTTRYPGFTAGERRDDIVSFLRTHDGKGAYLMHC